MFLPWWPYLPLKSWEKCWGQSCSVPPQYGYHFEAEYVLSTHLDSNTMGNWNSCSNRRGAKKREKRVIEAVVVWDMILAEKWLKIFIFESNGNGNAERGKWFGWNFWGRIWMGIFNKKLEWIRSVCSCVCSDVNKCACLSIWKMVCVHVVAMDIMNMSGLGGHSEHHGSDGTWRDMISGGYSDMDLYGCSSESCLCLFVCVVVVL